MASLSELRARRNRLVGKTAANQVARRTSLNARIKSRKSKLSIPTPNPNPQPDQKQSLQQKIASQQAARDQQVGDPTYSPESPLDAGQVESNLRGQQSDPSTWFAPSSYQSQPTQPDPRGPEYWANVTKLAFNASQNYAGNLQSQTYADVDYNKATEQANTNQARNVRGIGEQMMPAGLAYSGHANRTQREAAMDFGSQQEDMQTQKFRDDQLREVTRNAILQGYSVDEAAEMARAHAEYAGKQVGQATSGAAEMTPGDVSSATKVLGGKKKAAAKPKPKPKPKAGGGKKFDFTKKPMEPRKGRRRRRDNEDHREGGEDDRPRRRRKPRKRTYTF